MVLPRFPLVFGIVTTYRCPLACAHCCFQCGPRRREEIDPAKVAVAIQTLSRVSDVRCVAFTGGEPLLLKSLPELISIASSFGMATRIVTSAYWAVSRRAAENKIDMLVRAGLNELNISTGDCHSKFVPVEHVCQAAVTGALAGLRTLVVVEHWKRGVIDKQTILEIIKDKMNGRRPVHPVMVMENQIVPQGYDFLPSSSQPLGHIKTSSEYRGCNNVLLNLSLVPTGELYACCGLTMREIPELQVGTIDDLQRQDSAESFFRFYNANSLWHLLATEGPEDMARFVESEIGTKILEDGMQHRCHQCVALFSHPLSRPVLRERLLREKDILLMKTLQQQCVFAGVEGLFNEGRD